MAEPYPPVGFHFRVDFGLGGPDENDARFQEVSGLTAEMGTEELVEGGETRFTHRLPTRTKFGNLVLKRGLLKDSGLVRWLSDALENFEFKPVDVLVTLLNEEHQPILGWTFIGAWPVKWVVSDFKAMENALVVETLELAYKYFRRV
ncbi:MAG TPA: phage tail protein [Dissulfurispiraceae bacterium]|nr:phage tail protein [Dissulfurispiraceae bacterium]